MKKVCLIGANGQLGKELQQVFKGNSLFDLTALGSQDLDITQYDVVKNYFEQNKFDILVNATAYTAVDLAEKEAAKSNLVNNLAVQNLAAICKSNQPTLIHVSTDFVFDGSKCTPLLETDPTNPLQEYGKSKLNGEQAIENGIIIRTSWLYSEFGNNFVKTMMKLGAERSVLNVVDNQVGSPTYAQDLAKAILQICADDRLNEKMGIYHYSNEGVASWYDFACSIMEYAQLNCQVHPIPDSQYPTPAKRPAYSVMNKAKIKASFSIEIPHWRTSLKECINKLKQ